MPIINEIKHFDFNESGLSQLKVHDKGVNWPVVYLIHDEDNLYIGENYKCRSKNESTSKK